MRNILDPAGALDTAGNKVVNHETAKSTVSSLRALTFCCVLLLLRRRRRRRAAVAVAVAVAASAATITALAQFND